MRRSSIPYLFIYTALGGMLAGCAIGDAGRVVRDGDRVGLHFTCRMQGGEIAASSRKEINDSSLPKSRVFLKRDRGDTVVVEAGTDKGTPSALQRKAFEDEIMGRLAGIVVGKRAGESITQDIVSERIPGLPREEQFVKVSRVRTRHKEMKMSRGEFTGKTGKEPEVGQRVIIDPLFPGKVTDVSDTTVDIRFSPAATELDLPFGKGVVREKDDSFEVEIDAVKGALVRTGGLVGRVTEVDREFIHLDFGHPFGGETLRCEVKIESVEPGEKIGAASSSSNVAEGETEKALGVAFAKAVAESGKEETAEAQSGTVQAGDLVTVDYTAALEDGAIFSTTLENIAKDPEKKKVSWLVSPAGFAAVEIVAGKQELFPSLGEAVLGMAAGDKKQVRLTPDQAFGFPDPQKKMDLPCARTVPRVIRMPAEEYVKRFSSFPVLHKEVELTPYFKARVAEVTEQDVVLEFLAKDGETVTESYGTVLIRVAGDEVTTTLRPVVGAPFPLNDGMGMISATDGSTFTVDLNNPLAGMNIVLDLEVVSVAKAESLKGEPVDWIEDHERGLARAREEGKPVFLLLYADWCGWCRKTFTETIPDPRIRRLKERFVWVKVNSDKETKYKQQYGQDGFPMMVIMSSDGKVLKKIDGFRDSRGLKEELEGVL